MAQSDRCDDCQTGREELVYCEGCDMNVCAACFDKWHTD
jgi:hypothetical protein